MDGGWTRLKARLVELAQDAARRPERPSRALRVSPASLALAAVCVALAVGLGLTEGGVPPWVAVALITGPAGWVCHQLMQPSVNDRRTSEQAFGAYLAAVRAGHFTGAFVCLSHVARRTLERPPIPALGLDAERFDLGTADGLRRYWVLGGTSRSFRLVQVKPLTDDLHTALVVVELRRITNSTTRVALDVINDHGRATVTGSMAAYRRDGQWYLLDGGLPLNARVAIGH